MLLAHVEARVTPFIWEATTARLHELHRDADTARALTAHRPDRTLTRLAARFTTRFARHGRTVRARANP